MKIRTIMAASLLLSSMAAAKPVLAQYNFSKLLAAAPAKEAVKPALRDKWALLIGVDEFQDKSLKPNKESANNLEQLAAVLTDPAAGKFPSDHLMLLSGEDATKSGVERALNEWLFKKALPNDLIVIYVSSLIGNSHAGQPLAFSYDTLASEADVSGLNLASLAADVKRRTQSKYVLFAIDASPAPGVASVDLIPITRSGASLLSATNGSQPSLNNGVTGSSVFVHHLAEAIKHGGGTLNVQEVFDHVSKTVEDDATKAFNSKQTPLLVLAPNDSAIGQIAIGAVRKGTAPKQNYAIGHPLDRLGLDNPHVIAPRNTTVPERPVPAPQTAKLTPRNTGSVKTGAGATKTPGKTTIKNAVVEDEDEDSSKVDFSGWMAKMKQDIQKKWTPPKGLESRKVLVGFTIMRDGRITDPQVVQGSGVPEVDKSALDALQAASPLDPLPKGAPQSVDIKYKFDWNVRRD